MPYGFVGNASQKYLTSINDALSAAHAVHSREPYGSAGGAYPAPALPERNNYSAKYSPDTAKKAGYVTGMGNENNVVVHQSTYDEILQRLHSVDARIAEDLYNVALQIEEMCGTILITIFFWTILYAPKTVNAVPKEFNQCSNDSGLSGKNVPAAISKFPIVSQFPMVYQLGFSSASFPLAALLSNIAFGTPSVK